MKCLIFVAFALFLNSCTPNNTHPEQVDGIYKDLTAELGIAIKALDEEEKKLSGIVKEKELAVPQTGQIKFTNKKIADSLEKINVLKQHKQFFEIKVEQRLHRAQVKYQESLQSGGKPWPDPEEAALYNSVTKFQRDKIAWDKNKGMKKLVPRGTVKNN